MSARVDVLVVGAGLAGLECARRLGGAGARVLLADRKPTVDHAVHTTGIFVRRTLESFDLPEDCLGPPVRRVGLYSPRGRSMMLESPHDEYRVGRMGPLYCRALDACLRAGVQWAPSTSLAALEPDGAGSAAMLERGGRRERLPARFVVGADGAMSRVAAALGLDENREWIVGVEEVFRGVRTGHEPAFHCWIDPTVAPGYIAWVVDDGEEVHVGVGGYASQFRPAEALRRFHARVAPRFGLAGAAACERRGGRIPVGGVLPRIACARGLLTGDAAGAVSPLTAGGLDPCLRLSALAADVAGEFLATGDPAALAPYDGAALRARFRTRLLVRRVLAAVRSPAAAELACAALRLPPFRAAAHHVFFGRGSFPDVARPAGHGDERTADAAWRTRANRRRGSSGRVPPSPACPEGADCVVRRPSPTIALDPQVMPEAQSPAWMQALLPYAERTDYRVPLKVPIHMPSGRMISDVAGVFLRLPKWEGAPFADDFGKKAAGMVELEGEHLFAELAVLRLLEREGWSGRWVNTWSAGGEVWKYLTRWDDVPRAEQRNRVIEEEDPRVVLAGVARRAKKRYAGCWDVFAWRGDDFAFLQTKRGAPTAKLELGAAQAEWLHTALLFGDRRITEASFAVVNWDYR